MAHVCTTKLIYVSIIAMFPIVPKVPNRAQSLESWFLGIPVADMMPPKSLPPRQIAVESLVDVSATLPDDLEQMTSATDAPTRLARPTLNSSF